MNILESIFSGWKWFDWIAFYYSIFTSAMTLTYSISIYIAILFDLDNPFIGVGALIASLFLIPSVIYGVLILITYFINDRTLNLLFSSYFYVVVTIIIILIIILTVTINRTRYRDILDSSKKFLRYRSSK